MQKKFLTIRKGGLFYNIFDDDAKIIHYLLNYKIVNGAVGFPSNALNKIINTLDEKKISYIVFDNNVDVEKKDFKNLNQYQYYLSKACNKLEVGKIVDDLIKKLEGMDEDKLYEILDRIKKVIDDEF